MIFHLIKLCLEGMFMLIIFSLIFFGLLLFLSIIGWLVDEYYKAKEGEK